MLHGGVRTIVLWRIIVFPLGLGFGLGAFGIVGLIGTWLILIASRTLLTEIRVRKLPSPAKSFVRGQRWHRFRPAVLGGAFRPRRLGLIATNVIRRKIAGELIGLWILIGVVFLCGFAAGRSAG